MGFYVLTWVPRHHPNKSSGVPGVAGCPESSVGPWMKYGLPSASIRTNLQATSVLLKEPCDQSHIPSPGNQDWPPLGRTWPLFGGSWIYKYRGYDSLGVQLSHQITRTLALIECETAFMMAFMGLHMQMGWQLGHPDGKCGHYRPNSR